MRSNRKAGAAIILHQPFSGVHLRKRERLGILAHPIAVLSEQRSLRPPGALHLPESIAAVFDACEAIECADPCQQREFLALQRWDTKSNILCRTKRAVLCPRANDAFHCLSTQAGIAKAHAK